ncbi:glycosyltransferase family 4 protein [Rossellomorea sp. SC111]|uniref:glycosyltransferase family 4 protein n=1 Tax=Rossellomorea sp. SC111 TaxID=2968985 RepID=UPI00215AE020|nr:glycosyltransferase family 4 protein [Rossellomorea sp. SC111]MCR8850555.1 glycosyltransferase family 4 protein [Rossellomorea sp. SC111]
MNIWIFNHYAVGPNSTGITRHLDLSRELVKKGHKVTIFASSFNHWKRSETVEYNTNQRYKIKEYDGVRFIWMKTPAYYKNDFKRVKNILSYSRQLSMVTSKMDDNPDIIIGSLMHPLAAMSGYLIAKKKNCKFYFEERDLWPQSLIDLGKVSPSNPVVKVLSKMELFLYKKADKIIVLFDKAPKYVVSRGIDVEKVIYLPNGVDMNRYQEASDDVSLSENHLLLSPEKFNVIYTGAHSLANNLGAILNIAKKISSIDPEIMFTMVGDGPDKNSLIQRAKTENINNLKFIEAVPKESVPSLLKQADIGIISMKNAEVYKWGISLNKMYDYMAAKLPIVMLSNLEDTIISQHDLGYVEDSEDEVVKNIIHLKNSPDKTDKLGTRARDFVKDTHSWEKLAEKLHVEMCKGK